MNQCVKVLLCYWRAKDGFSQISIHPHSTLLDWINQSWNNTTRMLHVQVLVVRRAYDFLPPWTDSTFELASWFVSAKIFWFGYWTVWCSECCEKPFSSSTGMIESQDSSSREAEKLRQEQGQQQLSGFRSSGACRNIDLHRIKSVPNWKRINIQSQAHSLFASLLLCSFASFLR